MSYRQDVEMVQSWAVPAQTLVYAFRHLPRRRSWPVTGVVLVAAGIAVGWFASSDAVRTYHLA